MQKRKLIDDQIVFCKGSILESYSGDAGFECWLRDHHVSGFLDFLLSFKGNALRVLQFPSQIILSKLISVHYSSINLAFDVT